MKVAKESQKIEEFWPVEHPGYLLLRAREGKDEFPAKNRRMGSRKFQSIIVLPAFLLKSTGVLQGTLYFFLLRYSIQFFKISLK
jgi:hypothetical protein